MDERNMIWRLIFFPWIETINLENFMKYSTYQLLSKVKSVNRRHVVSSRPKPTHGEMVFAGLTFRCCLLPYIDPQT